MHHVRTGLAKPRGKAGEGEDVMRAGIAMDWARPDAQREAAGNARQGFVDTLAEPSAVEEDADLVAARGLLDRQVDHVAEQTAERRAENMRDPQFLGLQFTRRHHSTPTRTLDTNSRALPQARAPTASFGGREQARIAPNAVGGVYILVAWLEFCVAMREPTDSF